jgi:hypothetical protein
MENLLPRTAYDADETGMWKRMPLVGGILAFLFGGIGFGIIFPIGFKWLFSLIMQEPVSLPLLRIGLASGISFGILFGLVFALRFPARARKQLSTATDAIYFDDPKFIVLPPPHLGLTHRLPCSWMRRDNLAVGGVLYLGPSGFLFMPHTKNLPTHREPFEIQPIEDIRFSLVKPRLNILTRLLVERIPLHLEIESRDRSARFMVPEAESTLNKITRAIRPLNG